ncbi:DUF397 domain-containing protein [Kitasatospora sp. NPDC056731]|uniref:DUF397 domain-containing protein n=1 Tax=Kitasatospora sp. NPDC056731 TaxID=3155422 RepID=UPI0034464C86
MTHDAHTSSADYSSIVTADEKNHLDPTWVKDQLERAEWMTASTGGSNCLEVAFLDRGIVSFRDSLNPDKDPLILAWGEWADFLVGAKAGRFDRTTAPTA